MSTDTPLVSIITPVYNGASFLSECIDSVLKQTYQNWEYLIVDNCSTDGTAAIIRGYMERDPRIRVLTNDRTVDVIANHNIAFARIAGDSVYCKLVQADDWMFPECLERMVQAAESSPSVGIVGSYCLAGRRVRCDGLPYPSPVIPGMELGRMTLLGKIYLFWSPSCLMIRSALVRERQPFYQSPYLHADVEALYDLLRDHDFGFVHQVLTYIRAHEHSMTAQDARRANTQRLSHLHLLSSHGPIYLHDGEYVTRRAELLKEYYRALAIAIFDPKQPGFWEYQSSELKKLGYSLSRLRLSGAICSEAIFNPGRTASRLVKSMLARGD